MKRYPRPNIVNKKKQVQMLKGIWRYESRDNNVVEEGLFIKVLKEKAKAKG